MENEQSPFSNLSVISPTSQLILQLFRCFTYVKVHSQTLLLLLLRHDLSSFSNLSVTSLTSQLILQPFRRFTYVTAHSTTLPLLHLRQSSFSNLSFASPMAQALHLIQLASRPCPTMSVRLHSGALLHLGNFMGYLTRCRFAVTHNVVKNVEHSFVTYSDFRC